MDTKNLSGNVVDNKHIVKIYRFYFQGRRDNPIHEVAFNELIENLKERNTIWSNMIENSDRNH